MIKLPKEVHKILRVLDSGKFEAYAVKDCVAATILGFAPLDWDISTNANSNELAELFPDAIKMKNGIRLDYTDEQPEDGLIIDISTFTTSSINGELGNSDFTINAMADNPSIAFLDPHKGKSDIANKLIRTVNDPQAAFSENPLHIIKAIRLAAEYGFDLHIKTFEAIASCEAGLANVARQSIQDEFELMLQSAHAGKGLRMLADSGLMKHITGDATNHLTLRQRRDFNVLCDNIDLTHQNLLRRMGLFLICFDRRKGNQILKRFNYDEESLQHLTDALTKMEKLYFVKTETELRQFLGTMGQERYDYVNNLAKAQCKVYDYPTTKILARYELLKIVKQKKDPVFIEDLCLTAEDIEEAGIAQGEEAEQLLRMLLDAVHLKPAANERKNLLALASKYKRNKFAAKTRKITWSR